MAARGTSAGGSTDAASEFAKKLSAGILDDDNNDNDDNNNNDNDDNNNNDNNTDVNTKSKNADYNDDDNNGGNYATDSDAKSYGSTVTSTTVLDTMQDATTSMDGDSHADYDSEIYQDPSLLSGGGSSGTILSMDSGAAAAGRVSGRKPRWYGTKKFGGLHYLRDIEITGRLVVVEGPDASGRSTQIELLTAQLEAEGYAVLNTGLTRSEIIGRGILEAKRNVSLGVRTLAMFYAADFADQLEHKIIPALQAGHVVLADRYIYTLMARNTVRGIKRSWSGNLYSFALVPDMTFYLDVDPYVLVHRVFAKRHSLDYYESGADMGISQNMYESFIRYQQRLAREFEVLKKKYDLNIVDGNRSVDDLNSRLRKQILRYLSKVS